MRARMKWRVKGYGSEEMRGNEGGEGKGDEEGGGE
jgi:hypothetical protein